MIRVLLGHRGALLRGALATVFATETDLDVVAVLEHADEVLLATARQQPDVLVLDAQLPGDLRVETVMRRAPLTAVLMLSDRDLPAASILGLIRQTPRVGLIATDTSPGELVTAIRGIASGQTVLDQELVLAALRADDNPLTDRERQVLRLVTTGATAQEVARKLCLSSGTVRNYLSRILTKTQARTRIEAVRKAERAGWI
ncbi:response regulator transcription factor [Kribbella albertanoniae]|uniref:response regulator transcription factor n=1 Tax=Kribbella albertanoniae TaxID=1266829 RepID=UPI001EDD9588|nr:response regulator transcription factor [Kribbella albertanoniae]